MTNINKDKEALLTQEELKELLHYDPDTGWFTWKVDKGTRGIKGKRAGTLHKTSGYRCIKIKGHPYLEHRLCFLYMEGSWPPNLVDHEDRNRSNNKWDNLRHSTYKKNNLNRGKSRNILPMTQEECKQKYHYCKETGLFTHKVGQRKGNEAGWKGKSGIEIKFKCKGYQAHKLAFLYVAGEYPIGIVRHKDGDKFNNAWDNLELVAEKRSTVKGILWDKRNCKWQAKVLVEGKTKHLGRFKEESDAIAAVTEYRLKHNLDYIQTSDDGYVD